ncbi:MAG TPA: DUF881 domain-containing protein [Jatrophihabitans sp.]|nr:DUF881 domain-containing protein [Jatrophihabitans sp.]
MTGPPPAGDKRFVSVRLLTDLLDNVLDDGYREVASRRGANPSRRWYERPLVAFGCVLIGFLIVVGYIHTNRGAPEAAKVHDSLVKRVRTANDDTDALQRQVAALEREVAKRRAQALPASGALAEQLRSAEIAAGQLAVQGPGLTVTLRAPAAASASASPGRVGSVPIAATNILTDRDVRSVVNELWHDGAEAISVNDVRLSPTSAIRFAGEAVLVDFQPITSPYRIRAIGDADALSAAFAQSSVASRYQTLVGVSHIGFSFTESNRLTLPAAVPVTPRYATPSTPKPRR